MPAELSRLDHESDDLTADDYDQNGNLKPGYLTAQQVQPIDLQTPAVGPDGDVVGTNTVHVGYNPPGGGPPDGSGKIYSLLDPEQRLIGLRYGPTPPSRNEATTITAPGLPADLIRRRPDVRGAYLRLRAADEEAAAAAADRFPRISLTARAETSAEKARDLFDNWLAGLAANLVAPLFEGGARAA